MTEFDAEANALILGQGTGEGGAGAGDGTPSVARDGGMVALAQLLRAEKVDAKSAAAAAASL